MLGRRVDEACRGDAEGSPKRALRASGSRATNFFRYFFAFRPVSFLAARALGELVGELSGQLIQRRGRVGRIRFFVVGRRSVSRGLRDPGRFGMPRNHLNY
jgi:hypothetical protein